MLFMVEKGIRGGICYSIYWYAKVNNKYMRDYDKNKDISPVWGCKLFTWMGSIARASSK